MSRRPAIDCWQGPGRPSCQVAKKGKPARPTSRHRAWSTSADRWKNWSWPWTACEKQLVLPSQQPFCESASTWQCPCGNWPGGPAQTSPSWRRPGKETV
eukprot:2071236-Heterocapsa_arctica.AAC.1